MTKLTLVLVLVAAPAVAQDANARAARLAKGNVSARRAMSFVLGEAKRIRSPAIRATVLELASNPAPTFLAALDREAARKALVDAGYLDAEVTVAELFPPIADARHAPQAFDSAPGGTLDHHHAWPGGLAEHVAFNLDVAERLAAVYRERYGISELDSDLVIAAPILHDAMKPWCLQWRADGTLTAQATIAGTSSHHVFILAELMHRGMPAALVEAVAAAHDAPLGPTAKGLGAFLGAAALLAGKPAPQLDPAHVVGLEALIDHLSDHDYVVTDPAGQLVADALVRLARAAPGGATAAGARLRWMRHRVLSRLPAPKAYALLVSGGDAALARELLQRKLGLVDDADAE